MHLAIREVKNLANGKARHLAPGQLAQGRDVIGINGKIAATSAA